MTDMLSVILSELISVNTIEISFLRNATTVNNYYFKKIHVNLAYTSFPASLHRI
jgi:hypothetical protein